MRKALASARLHVANLRGQETVLTEQLKRHRSRGESGALIRSELSSTRSALYYAREEVRFQERVGSAP